MKKVKIILVISTSESYTEHEVASFKTLSEAKHCAALLQAMVNNPDYLYYTEYKGRRSLADSFYKSLQFFNEEQLIKVRAMFMDYVE